MFTIEKDKIFGGDVGVRGRSAKGKSKYPFPEMVVGDSVLIPEAQAQAARLSAGKFGRMYNMTFVSRKAEDGSVRIWRVA